MKSCPYCGEELKDTALRCKRCRNLVAEPEDLPFAIEKFYPLWDLTDIGLAYFVVVLVTVFLYFPLAPLMGLNLADPKVYDVVSVLDEYWSATAMLVVVYFTVCRKYELPFASSLRLKPMSFAKAMGFMALGAALGVVANVMVRLFGITVMTGQKVPGPPHFTAANVLFVFYVLTLGPFFEEILFRGLIYPALNRRVGLVAAVVLTSAAFAAVHLITRDRTLDVFVLYLIGALGITTARALTVSTTAAIFCHVGFNLLSMALAFLSR